MVQFLALEPGSDAPPMVSEPTITLAATWWDDWFRFRTEYVVTYRSASTAARMIGTTKIGRRGLVGNSASAAAAADDGRVHRSPDLPESFSELDPGIFFSLGQDEEFYQNLTDIGGAALRDKVLQSLCDVAYDPGLLSEISSEPVMQESLLRSVPITTVTGTFADLAHGRETTLRAYAFSYTPSVDNPFEDLEFQVTPGSLPPSNVHVVIGRNGVGKTTALMNLARDMYRLSRTAFPGQAAQLANLVTVSFSAFDTFEHPKEEEAKATTHALTYRYIGLRQPRLGDSLAGSSPQSSAPADALPEDVDQLKSRGQLAEDLAQSLDACLKGARLHRLRRALAMLEGDPIFSEASIGEIVSTKALGRPGTGDEQPQSHQEIVQNARHIFLERLSSGHAIALLTMVQLVESVHERTLVIMDEPEAHLHPPLLSAFIRAVSDLLIAQNGLAVISTHSPVVLQEVPRSCVSVMRRSGKVLSIGRPARETFGENVGTLTDEVFGLEVEATGFHTLLRAVAADSATYDDALARFGGQLGSEGRGILRAIMMHKASSTNVVR